MTFYPANNSITAISQESNAVISLSETNDLTAGQVVRINVPKTYGMIQINEKLGNILSVTSSSITVDIDSTHFDAFSVPGSPVQSALIIPVGETANENYANNLDDATRNVS